MLSRSLGSRRTAGGAEEPCVEVAGEAVAGFALAEGLFPMMISTSQAGSLHGMPRVKGMSLEGLKRTRYAYKYADEAREELASRAKRAHRQPAIGQCDEGLLGRNEEEYRESF